jgi:hypothetical protein
MKKNQSFEDLSAGCSISISIQREVKLQGAESQL